MRRKKGDDQDYSFPYIRLGKQSEALKRPTKKEADSQQRKGKE